MRYVLYCDRSLSEYGIFDLDAGLHKLWISNATLVPQLRRRGKPPLSRRKPDGFEPQMEVICYLPETEEIEMMFEEAVL